MRKSKVNVYHRADVVHDVLHEIERLRITRQEEVRDRPHPLLKRFTQQELTDVSYPTYKNLLVGRSHRVPSRQSILQISSYLHSNPPYLTTFLLPARYL